jgi:hypothetical protein
MAPITNAATALQPEVEAPGHLSRLFDQLTKHEYLKIMLSLRQLVATRGNGFHLFEQFLRASDLPPVATGCDRSAP